MATLVVVPAVRDSRRAQVGLVARVQDLADVPAALAAAHDRATAGRAAVVGRGSAVDPAAPAMARTRLCLAPRHATPRR